MPPWIHPRSNRGLSLNPPPSHPQKSILRSAHVNSGLREESYWKRPAHQLIQSDLAVTACDRGRDSARLGQSASIRTHSTDQSRGRIQGWVRGAHPGVGQGGTSRCIGEFKGRCHPPRNLSQTEMFVFGPTLGAPPIQQSNQCRARIQGWVKY